MMKIKSIPVVNSWEIEEEFGIRVFDCPFTEMVANDSYVSLSLDDEYLADLEDAYNYAIIRGQEFKKFENEIELVKKFRELGYTEEILVLVSW